MMPCTRPDRFVSAQSPEMVHKYRTSKDVGLLTMDERFLRHKDASPDSFSARRSRGIPLDTFSGVPVPGFTMTGAGRHNISGNRSGGGGASVLTFQHYPPGPDGERQVSVGTVWAVGGIAPTTLGVADGQGRLLGNGTNAPLYTTTFSTSKPKSQDDMEKHEGRLAEALELDRAARVLEFRELPRSQPRRQSPQRSLQSSPPSKNCCTNPGESRRTTWNGSEWVMNDAEIKKLVTQESRTLPIAPFKVLDAPGLRDDFYCSVLAYSATCHTLVVGLGTLLYAWSEMNNVRPLSASINDSWITSLAFSSTPGGKSILAIGRSDGSLSLMSLYDSLLPRFELLQPCPIACIAWRPITSVRASRCPVTPSMIVKTEDLLVGDEMGSVYYYSVEWPERWEVTRNGWSGSMTLLSKISIHTQQICGLSFDPEGTLVATGGNDNLCCIFESNSILCGSNSDGSATEEAFDSRDGIYRTRVVNGSLVKEIRTGAEKHRWIHGAAVKAIAFCPWRKGLVATGGGSNDKCIHFFHTSSGACLATISVSAQVTSLIWSTTRREIAATFGYAQPEHPYRIAVFSWPECKQVAAIPWEGEHRALYAIPYPGGPNEGHTSREGGIGLTRTAKEGCIVVASSDESVKFHEVWTSKQKTTAGGEGLLGGSDILESLEGIDKEGTIIR
ncbi:WD40-repeat-containing domain protein [Amylocarpus encephaloides]|uniref:WD40-repeat-containing domain protein n=1 Tax=Amylocarpus encephaloides TaxID=45428 RepID=A0A9P8C4Y4_9HELO|nr:WD40-repeat-containing domain protein [Amylocarpus encephaloides]